MLELGDDEVLLPGLVDSHVHVNDPGRTEWEGFTTATRAAAAGGVTTIVDMPLNSIPPTVRPGRARGEAEDRRAAGVRRRRASGAAPSPATSPDLRPLHDAGVFGFKCFLLHSGVDEFPPLDPDQLEAAMREIASFDGLMIVHAEDTPRDRAGPDRARRELPRLPGARGRAAPRTSPSPRSSSSSRWTGCRVHILHVSSSDALPMIASAPGATAYRITAETCPHYLTFAAEEIPDGATQYKCCPPIREARQPRAALGGPARRHASTWSSPTTRRRRPT